MKTRVNKNAFLIGAVAALLLAACAPGGAEGTATPDPTAQAAQARAAATVSATGEVLPARESTLSFNVAGAAVDIMVEEGDVVQEGAIIARLKTDLLELAVARAEANVTIRQAELVQTSVGARSPEIAEAAANTEAARAELNQAITQFEDLAGGSTEVQILEAQVEVVQAYNSMMDARALWNYYEGILRADRYVSEYDELEFRLLPGGIDATRESYDLALLGLEAEEAQLEEVLRGADDQELFAAEADVAAARAAANAEAAALGALAAGAREEAIAVDEAELEQARADLEAAILDLEDATIRAPFDGTIANIYIEEGEYVNGGEAIIDIGQLDTLRVETTDLNEIDVARFDIGAPATITFDAYPGLEVGATVISISPRSEEGTGVNYRVVLEMDEVPAGVLWGMTAFVDIEAERAAPNGAAANDAEFATDEPPASEEE